jgi:hypothetical protein
MNNMPVKCDIPSTSALDRRLIESSYFQDSYSAPLARTGASITDIFQSIFAHHPVWVKVLLIIRNWLASLCGLAAPTVDEILHPAFKNSYHVGDKIGVWPIMSLTDNELIAGRDNKHLDFRLSVMKVMEGGQARVVVSTICMVHNTFGKVYLFFIVPFHKWGVQRIIANAIAAGRL